MLKARHVRQTANLADVESAYATANFADRADAQEFAAKTGGDGTVMSES